MTDAKPESHFSIWFVGLLGIAGLVFLVLRFGDLEAFGRTVRHAAPAWLGGAMILQVATYASVAGGWNAVLARAGARQPFRRPVPIAITKLFADQVLPSAGVGGNLLLVDQLTAIGAPRSAAVAEMLVSMIGNYIAYAILAVAMLLLLWMQGWRPRFLAGWSRLSCWLHSRSRLWRFGFAIAEAGRYPDASRD